jgi:pyridoxal phosphate enzyme (YggS family)
MTRLELAIERIEKARISYSRHQIIQLVAVSKYTTAQQVRALYGEGQRAFGENKVQDLELKAEALEDLPIAWHFIGTLQKNKINKLIAQRPVLVHSIDSLELAQAYHERLERAQKTQRALLQINSAREESKSGVDPDEAVEIYHRILETCPALKLEGVMTIGAHTDDRHLVQKSFEKTHTLFEKLQSTGAKTCSMGMSGDYELAIACGSNMVRLGSVLFDHD